MAAADFILDIEQRIRGDAATELDKTQKAFDAAASALKRFEGQQMAADKALASVSGKLETVRGKMAAAMEAGNTNAFWKAASEAQKLEAQQAKLAERSAAAKARFDEQAQAVEALGDKLAGMNAEQRAAAEAMRMASEEAKIAAEQLKNLEKATADAARAAEKAEAAFQSEAVKAAAEQQKILEGYAKATTKTLENQARAAENHARVMQQQQAKAIQDVDQRMQRMNQTAMAAAVALVAVAAVAAKAAWAATKWVGAFVFAKKAKELEALSGKLKKNFGDIFGGLNLEPIMAGLSRLVDFFDTSTSSGKALKALFEGLFGPLADNAEGVFVKIERFMLGMVIGALKVGIAIKKMAAEFGFDLGAFETWPDIGRVGESVAYAVVAAMAAMGVAVAAAAWPYYQVIDAIANLKTAWDQGKKGVEEFVTQMGVIWDRLDFGAIATNLIDGFVKGIKDGIARAVAAVEQLATEAVNAAKNKLKVFSPSRVFEAIGGFVAEGFAGGVNEGAPEAQGAVAALVEPPDAPVVRSSGGGAVVTFAAGAIVIQAADGADAADRFVERLTEALEGLGMQVGAPA